MQDPKPPHPDLEIKDAIIIFRQVWEQLLAEFGETELRFPKELILLGGAPGSGKGTQTRFISETRGLTCAPVVVSELLDSPEARKIKDQGGMVGDTEVIGIILRELLKPDYRDGAILDGFPRTQVQVECLKLLIDRMNELWRKYHETHHALHFRKPVIHGVILFVEERVSIHRQISRGEQIIEHNKEVEASGVGEIIELRKTDLSEETARKRYKVFKEQTWEALKSLKQNFFYHFINAHGSIETVEQNILTELQYQSSLELDPTTFQQLRKIPLAEEIVVHARQDLVHRLDRYAIDHPNDFKQVVFFIQDKMMPIVERHAITGRACINTESRLFDDPLHLSMLIDVFSERGYRATADQHRIEVPERFDAETGEIHNRVKRVYRFEIRFAGSKLRRG